MHEWNGPILRQYQESRQSKGAIFTIKKEFSVDYTDKFGNLERLWRYLTVASKRGGMHPIYSKSCAIVQSSCSGKTRSVLELGHHLPLFYVCQRQPDDSGYPKQNIKLTEKLALTLEEKEQCKGEPYHLDILRYCKCVSFLCALSIVANAAWRDYQKQVVEEKAMNKSDFFVGFMEKQYTEAFWDPIMKIVKELAQE